MEDNCFVSVVMPCYNVEKYIDETLDSLVNQSLQDIEIICLDDGSTDDTLNHLKKYEEKYSNIKVISETNHKQGYERNLGASMAHGKYLYFMDSDDLLDAKCLELISGYMEKDNLDLAFFEADSFFETEELSEKYGHYKTLYHRKHEYPDVMEGKDLFVLFRANGDMNVSPCMQMVRREVIIDNHIKFDETLPMLEDNIYSIKTLLAAKRTKCFRDVLYKRRVRESSTMTLSRIDVKCYSYQLLLREILSELDNYIDEPSVYDAILVQGLSIVRQLNNCYERDNIKNNQILSEQVGSYQAEDLIPLIMLLDSKYQNVMKDRKERIDKLQAEKSDLSSKLQRAKLEKSDADSKLQKAYAEKTEINSKLQKAYAEKSEINSKLQEAYKDKTERGEKIKELQQSLQSEKKQKKAIEKKLEKLKKRKIIRIAMKIGRIKI